MTGAGCEAKVSAVMRSSCPVVQGQEDGGSRRRRASWGSSAALVTHGHSALPFLLLPLWVCAFPPVLLD